MEENQDIAPDDGSDNSDYEYEYDDSQTESFYVSLDLTSLTGPLRVSKRRKLDNSGKFKQPTTSTSFHEEEEGDEEEDVVDPLNEPEPHSHIPENEYDGEIQILGLHTHNPIISYQGQAFSCTWADMIGTEMLFSHPYTDPRVTPLRQADGYDLIAVNRVKILGQKATLTAKAGHPENEEGDGQIQQSEFDELEDEFATSTTIANDTRQPILPEHEPTPTAQATINNPLGKLSTRQGKFLQRLLQAKRKRGEDENLRISHVTKGVYSGDWSDEVEKQTQQLELLRLRRLALRGDWHAIKRLEEMSIALDHDFRPNETEYGSDTER